MSLGFLIQDGLLANDLDCALFNLLNVQSLNPVPNNLVASDDPRLTDARVPLDGSVTDSSVAPGAGIVQSKLNLNGACPPSFLGTDSTHAAEGDQAEYIANKGQPGGYASLDNTGKIPAAQLSTAVGAGTVTSVGLSLPADLTVSGSPVTGAGTLAAVWASVTDQSWFGRNAGSAGTPQFYTTPLPTGLIPSLDASIIVSGTFAVGLLPIAVGIGSSHAPGAVPDPGTSGGGHLATDYLARDMTYKAIPSLGPSYQPTIGTPVLSGGTNPTGPINVTPSLSSDVSDVVFFYSLTSSSTGFIEFPSSGYVSLASGGATLWCYAAAPGYTNSAVASITNSNP